MTNRHLNCAVAAALSAIAALSARSAEVSADSAGVAAQRWLEEDAALGCRLGSEVDAVRTCHPQADASFHVVSIKGGGFVVMSADTTREPVVAFSSGGELVESDANPLWVLLKSDLALRAAESARTRKTLLTASASNSAATENEAKWNRLLGKTGGLLRASQGVSTISDVRVAPLVQSKWNQDNVGDKTCYNYYTPNHYVCGCVATAGAQIMRYFEWPRSNVSVAQFTNPHCKVDGVTQTMTSQGGYCNWSLMPLVPSGSITDAQRQAIGKLTSDIGICVGMKYADGGSSAGGYMLADAFTNHYGYANALAAHWESDISGTDDMKNALLSNFDAGLPVALGLSGDGGHEVVGDGYGYSGDTLYIHMNMGWSGYDDAWYAPPRLGTSQYNFSMMTEFVCNVFTNSAHKGGVICSGRVLDASGSPIANATVTASIGGNTKASATTNAKGIYALVLTELSADHTTRYTLRATSGGSNASTNVSLKANVGIKLINSGDSFGGYWLSPTPSIGNRCGQDITINGIAGVDEPQFSPPSCLFYPSTNVTITCATSGATIRYTTDGSDPTETSTIYSGPITITDDIVISARAWKSGMNPSSVVTEIYTYDAAQGAPKGDYFADPIVISGESGTRVIDDNSDYTVEDGEPWHTLENGTSYYQYHTVWYKWTAPGSGTMNFSTAVQGWYGGTFIAAYTGETLPSLSRIAYSIEWNPTNNYSAVIKCAVEQGEVYYIVGMVSDDSYTGTFTLTWSGNLTVAQAETSTTDVPVPYAWLDGYFPGQGSGAQEYEALAGADSDGDGIANWAEYLLGTDPTNALSRLVATIRMDGATPVIESNADASRLAEFGYRPVVKGKATLDSSDDWATTNILHRFFRIFLLRGTEPANQD